MYYSATFTDVSCKLHIRIFKAEEVVFRQRTEPVRDVGPIPESGRSPGVGNGKPLQYSCLENSLDRGAWSTIAHGVAKGRTQLSICALTHASIIYISTYICFCRINIFSYFCVGL